MLIAWQLIKLGASNFLAFIIKHWRVIVPLLVLWYCYAQYSNEVKRADTAELALLTMKAELQAQMIKRTSENAVKLAVAKKALQESEKQHLALVAKLNLDRQRETQNLKDLYEKRIDSTKHNFIERVRIESDKAERYRLGMSDTGSDTSGLTERERECYAGYSTLERACQVTTIDYNRLRGWADAACEQVGCK